VLPPPGRAAGSSSRPTARPELRSVTTSSSKVVVCQLRRIRRSRQPSTSHRLLLFANSSQPEAQRSTLSDPIVIAPEGDLDIARIGEFRAVLNDAARDAEQLRIVVDLSHLESIDSSGLGALVELHHRLRREKRQLAVVAPSGTAAALILNLSGLQNRLPTYETRHAAIFEHTS
jgi:anti-anti-sigma factor